MKILLVRVLLLLLAIAFLCCSIVSGQVGSELDSINGATSAIYRAFDSVLEAETLGGNVTTLLQQLNTAGFLLSQAQNSFASGNATDSAEDAQKAFSIADQVNSQALSLKILAEDQSKSNIFKIVTLSSVGAIVFTLSLLLIWRRVKSSYLKRMLDLKIEGIANGT